MPRLIEVPNVRLSPAIRAVAVGDVLLFHASGGRIRSGKKVVELLGAFPQAIVGDDGAVVTPMGTPNTVLLRACRPGRARMDLMVGDPFHDPQTTTVEIRVGD